MLLRIQFTLQEDLQIGVLGHRQAILAAIKVLPRQNHATLSSDQSPNHSPEPPGSPTLKAKQQRQRLLRELEKVEGHTAVLQQYDTPCTNLIHLASS